MSGKESLDEEFGIPCIKTFGVRKAQETYKKPRSNPQACKFGRVQNPIDKLMYDSYVACHCAYMAKIV